MSADDGLEGWDLDGKGSTIEQGRTARALRLTVEEASNLPVPGRFSRTGKQGHLPVGTPAPGLNPYAVVKHGESRRLTRSSTCNAWPKWNKSFEFAVESNAVTTERPWRNADSNIVVEIMNEDKFTMDTLIATVTIPSATIDELLIRGDVGAVKPLLEPLESAVGLPLAGAGAQPAILSLRLEIIEVETRTANRDEETTDKAAHLTPILVLEPRSPEKLKEQSAEFFEKLQQSPVWRGRHGDKRAHQTIDTPDLPFERYEERNAKSLLSSAGILEPQIALLGAAPSCRNRSCCDAPLRTTYPSHTGGCAAAVYTCTPRTRTRTCQLMHTYAHFILLQRYHTLTDTSCLTPVPTHRPVRAQNNFSNSVHRRTPEISNLGEERRRLHAPRPSGRSLRTLVSTS